MFFNLLAASALSHAQMPEWDPPTMRDEMAREWIRVLGTYYACSPGHDDENCRTVFGPSFRCVRIDDPTRLLYKATECAHDSNREPCHFGRRLEEETKSDSLVPATPAFRRQSMGQSIEMERGSAGMETMNRICSKDSDCTEEFGSDAYCLPGAGHPFYPQRYGLCIYPWVSDDERWDPCQYRDRLTMFCNYLKWNARRLESDDEVTLGEAPKPEFRRQSMGQAIQMKRGSSGIETMDYPCFQDSDCTVEFGPDAYCPPGAGPQRYGLCIYPWVSDDERWDPCQYRHPLTGFCKYLKGHSRRLESDDELTIGEAPKPDDFVPSLIENELPATRRIERTEGGCPLDSNHAARAAPCGPGVRQGTQCHYTRCAETNAYGIYVCQPEGYWLRLRTEYGECAAWNGRIFERGDVMGYMRGDVLYDWQCPGGKRCEGVPGSHENGKFGQCLKTAAEVMNELYPGH